MTDSSLQTEQDEPSPTFITGMTSAVGFMLMIVGTYSAENEALGEMAQWNEAVQLMIDITHLFTMVGGFIMFFGGAFAFIYYFDVDSYDRGDLNDG